MPFRSLIQTMTDLANPVSVQSRPPDAAGPGQEQAKVVLARQGDGDAPKAHDSSRYLRGVLVTTDGVVACVTWLVVLMSVKAGDSEWAVTRALPFSVSMAALTVALISSQRLYQARVCALRSAEVSRLSRVAVIVGLTAFALGRYHHILSPWVVAISAAATFLALVGARSVYAGWLRLARFNGYFARHVCVVGTNDEAEDLVNLLGDHPELGYRVTAVIGDPEQWGARVPDLPAIPVGLDPAQTVRESGATGVVVASSALSNSGRDRLISRLMADGIHVQLSAGLSRLGHTRMRIAPLAHHLAFYIEPPQLSGGQAAMKRILDIAVALGVVIATAPVVAVAAVLIKIEDGGPVFYRQERVGLNGQTFWLWKLRTMVPDASQRLGELDALNERHGPLFKVSADPRVTRVGRFLRTTSIDEIPQLINVLQGEMSVVGPRPALPSEFAQFDDDLVERAQVLPGITGLWQVEARDNPSFRAYRRLDLFYVDNWSIAFDLAIMAGTVRMLAARTAVAVWSTIRRGHDGSGRRAVEGSSRRGPEAGAAREEVSLITEDAQVESVPAGGSKIAVVGAGYVGLTTAVCLAHLGHRVHAVDIDAARVERMSQGETPILEEGLAELMHEGLESRRLHFTTDAGTAAADADFVFLCVPTPQGADGSCDLSFVEQASMAIAPFLKEGAVVINKSTVPVGSAMKVMAALGRPDTVVVSNPEFLREGHAIHDWMHPDRIVIGSQHREAAERLALLYEPLGAPCLVTDPASSETIKYASNAFLAAKVSFVNAIARLCEAVGANSVDVIRGMSYDKRIGGDHLAPGPGWGGSCFPKDTTALMRTAENHGYDFALLREVILSNLGQFEWVADQVEDAVGGRLDGVTVAAWGLTFKAGTDDLRESPALEVLRRLRSRGAVLKAFDPTVHDPTDPHFDGLDLEVCVDAYTACEDAPVLLLLTDWPEFREADLAKVASLLTGTQLVDTRNLLDPEAVRAAGLSYRGMGRSA